MIKQILNATALAVISFATPAVAQDSNPVVIELYTSQGCSSCPPADALLKEYADRDDVITLALHVDYWDYIGWADTLARPEHADRQRGYAAAAHKRTIYTPQMVLNGEDHVVGSHPDELADGIKRHQARAEQVSLDVERDGDILQIRARNIAYETSAGEVELLIVRYTPEETVEIQRGENAGKRISYGSIVTGIDVLTRWNAQEDLTFSTDGIQDGPLVVLVQKANYGSVLAAARLR